MERLGPYKLETVLGRGGMGTVYKAVDTETGLTLAVKVIAPTFSTDDHFRNRFESEIKALLKLDHPNIVRLISYGQDDQNLYFAMELVQGRSLFQLQRDGVRFDWREVIRIAKNVALGLRHAHDRGVIHRDLKPGNLIRADSGIIKITDFGIAKRFGQHQNTGTNVLGTLDFMSPEQAGGQPVTARSDLYSLGTVMYTLLAGRPPFTADSFEESMRNLTKVPAPRIVRQAPDVPSGLDNLIAQLLAKDPEERIPTALSLYHQLKQVEQDLRISSQADTTEQPQFGSSEKTMATLQEPSTSVDKQRVSGHTVVQEPVEQFLHRAIKENAGESTQNNTAGDQSLVTQKPPVEVYEDFFNPVTEEERLKNLQDGAGSVRHSHLNKIVLCVMLVTVLALGVYGAVVVNRTPTARALLAQFEEDQNSPHKNLEELDLFLDRYPDHRQAAWVRQLRDLAPGTLKIRQLKITRARSLSKIEQDFLQIVDESLTDAPYAAEKLKAFVTLYEGDDSLDSRDMECVIAAKAILPKVSRDAESQVESVRTRISKQLARALELPGQDAVATYQSIIELNKEFSWASDLVEIARQKMRQLSQ